MSDVASEAGVSPGLAYHYFQSKEAIFLVLARRSVRPPEELRAIVQQMPGTPRDRLKRMLAGILERRRKDPEFYQFFYQAMASDSLPADLREKIKEQGLSIREIMRGLIVEGQATGEIAKDDPDELVQAIMACLNGLSRLAFSSPKETGSHVPDARIILRMLRPDQSEE